MRYRYLDVLSLVQRFRKFDIFLTMTCNPKWKEIQDELKQNLTPQDRPDVTSRIFRAKLKDLKDQLFKKDISIFKSYIKIKKEKLNNRYKKEKQILHF